MIGTPKVPAVHANGRRVSGDDVEFLAARWYAVLERGAGHEPAAGPGPLAVALGGDAEGVALFTAVSARPGWFVLLPPDARVWPRLGLPGTTEVILPPGLSALGATARAVGWRATVLESQPAAVAPARSLPLLQSDGIVFFTSGSTGAPKPVYRSMPALLAGVVARLTALGLESGEGIVAGVALGHGHGLTRMLTAMCLGGPFAVLAPLDHRAALSVLAEPGFGLWSATAHFADVLGRCRLTGPAVVPRICLLSSPVSLRVHEVFRSRFGVPLRQNYSSSETGVIAVDAGPAADVCPESVGRPVPGVEVRIGDRGDASPPGAGRAAHAVGGGDVGRIWVRSPWQMDGYGLPPDLTRPGAVDGWWPTRDLGSMRDDGRLVLAGRLDDCIRTREGRLVNLAVIANSLRELDGVHDAAVVPLAGEAGASFGAVMVCATPATLTDVRERITARLPEWAWPRALVQVPALPRLMGGKIDRQRCIALLDAQRSTRDDVARVGGAS